MIVLKATQDKVLAVLQSVSGIVERRHTLPILANVLIRKTGNALQLTTSDLEIQIRTTAELGGDVGDFTTTVGARKLIDILKTMPADQTVSLESSQSKLILKGGKSRFTLQSLPAEDFPLVQESPAFGPAFSVPQKVLKGLLGQVSFAMAVQDIRYYLNGILFVAEGKTLSLVATDGHRLAQAELEAPAGSQGLPGSVDASPFGLIDPHPAQTLAVTTLQMGSFLTSTLPPGFSNGVDGGTNAAYNPSDVSQLVMQVDANQRFVPEPASMALLGLGMAGMAALRRRK